MRNRNRYKEIYQTIPEGCNRESQLYKKAAETLDKDTRGWLTVEPPESCGRQLRGWVNKIRTMLNLFQHLPLPNQIKEKILFITTGKRETLKQVQGSPQFMTTRKAFTLLELLVVVLIIGILAAIAVPQYQKAVWKSRAVQLQLMVKSLAQAQERYYMANGTYATKFSELDISFDSLPQKPATSSINLTVQSTDGVRENEFMELIIHTNGTWWYTMSGFTTGPYTSTGFITGHISNLKSVQLEQSKIYCWESRSLPQGIFCEKVMGLKPKFLKGITNRMYVL